MKVDMNNYGNLSSDMGRFLADFMNAIKDANLERKIRVQKAVEKLTQDQNLSAVQLEGMIRKIRLKQDKKLEKIEKEKNAEIKLLEERLAREANEYIAFLDSIDELKERLQKNYNLAPKAIFLTIYRRASKILHKMWDANNENDFQIYQTKFLNIIRAAAEDNFVLESGEGQNLLPEKTLIEIQKK